MGRLRNLGGPAPVELTLDNARELVKQMSDKDAIDPRCQHCKGIHARACPRVKSMEFKGNEISRVEFWQEWDSSSVLWPEDVVDMVLKADTVKEGE